MDRPDRPDLRPGSGSRRLGFTLVEILVVILIIAILLALLLPAIAGAFRRAREAQVAAELNNMATALASFKTTYGAFPPSRVLLPEAGFTAFFASAAGTAIAGAGSNDSDITDKDLANRSLAILRSFWPRVNFLVPPTSPGFFDFNGNGINDGALGHATLLNGSECLTFFLGGIPILNNGVVTGVSGFSKLPTNPFINSTLATNRTAANYEFVAGRLVDLDGDHIPSYLDPLDITPGNRRAYAYFASYGTNSYDPNDINGLGHNSATAIDYEFEEDGSTPVARGFLVNFPVYLSGTNTASTLDISPSPNPYTSGPAASGTVSWLNPNSFQLFSAGQDRYYGLGGTYVQNSLGGNGKLPMLPVATDPGNINGDDQTGIRQRESDNITNFSGGRLD